MRMRLLVALAAGLMVGAADPAPDLGEVEQEQVIPPGSRWRRVENGSVWEFGKDGKLRVMDDDGWRLVDGRYRTDPKANPPRFDLTGPFESWAGIYRVEGRRLLFCFPRTLGGKRPTWFTDGPDS